MIYHINISKKYIFLKYQCLVQDIPDSISQHLTFFTKSKFFQISRMFSQIREIGKPSTVECSEKSILAAEGQLKR
jgi:hypothetical protein